MEITQERKWFSGTRTALTKRPTQLHRERNSECNYVEFLSRAVLENLQYHPRLCRSHTTSLPPDFREHGLILSLCSVLVAREARSQLLGVQVCTSRAPATCVIDEVSLQREERCSTVPPHSVESDSHQSEFNSLVR